MLKCFPAIFFMCVVVYASAQQKEIDSLRNVLPSLSDTARIDCLLKISFKYGHINNDSDVLFVYVNSDSAILYAKKALTEAKQIPYLKGMANAFENLGEMANSYNLHDGEDYLKQAILLYDKINDLENLNWSYLWLGFYLTYECEFDKARSALEKALFYYKRSKNEAREARTYGLLSDSYSLQGYYKKAFDYCLKYITIIQKNNKYKTDPIATSLSLGDLYAIAGDNITALKYYRQSADYSKGYHNQLYYEIKVRISMLENNYDSALYYCKLIDSSKNNSAIGKIYLHKKDYAEALLYFIRPLAIAKKRNNIFNEMVMLDEIANNYARQNKLELALKYAGQLLKIANSTHARQFIKDGNWLKWKIYDQEKKIDSAYKYRLQFDNTNDSIAADELSRNLAVTKMKFEDEQKQSQIDLLKKDNQINQQQVKNESIQKKILSAVMIVTVLIGFIIFRTFILKRKNEELENQRTQAELQTKATDLEMQALRSQMNPHFVFNCLSSINRFILKNKTEEASDYLTKFSRLIRMVLNNSKQAFISLEDELETLRLYLDMERLRFKNSFDYSFTYKNSVEASNIFIPPLLIQPFAENAIWHGLMHKQEKGFLNFDFSAEENFLTSVITDNGVGREQAEQLKSKSVVKQKSMGLKITAERLSLLNNNSKEQTFFTIEDLTDENGNAIGTRVHLKIFYKEMMEV